MHSLQQVTDGNFLLQVVSVKIVNAFSHICHDLDSTLR